MEQEKEQRDKDFEINQKILSPSLVLGSVISKQFPRTDLGSSSKVFPKFYYSTWSGDQNVYKSTLTVKVQKFTSISHSMMLQNSQPSKGPWIIKRKKKSKVVKYISFNCRFEKKKVKHDNLHNLLTSGNISDCILGKLTRKQISRVIFLFIKKSNKFTPLSYFFPGT